jgi:hypothetical protein
MSTARYAGDRQVQEFIEGEVCNIGPFPVPKLTRTAPEAIEAAHARFGKRRCRDLVL